MTRNSKIKQIVVVEGTLYKIGEPDNVIEGGYKAQVWNTLTQQWQQNAVLTPQMLSAAHKPMDLDRCLAGFPVKRNAKSIDRLPYNRA